MTTDLSIQPSDSSVLDSIKLFLSYSYVHGDEFEEQQEVSTDVESIQKLLDSDINTVEIAEAFATDTGIMMAAEGTTQGQSGWYYDRQGNLVYWNVNENGVWTRIDTEMN